MRKECENEKVQCTNVKKYVNFKKYKNAEK